ncbi:hypothetical protein [Polyangium sorediatum]|uniref:TFIIB-type zinc ribbon-containing protein n=1 Tax=Polyangium sorediatum TaxID=889274 RepID=A0ABT6NHZ3_9BACT|nr:hypothetical protein [Polyangium sorediatum]MDI1427938.1 hypothetical protein [Polyangium sorediatum]
MESRPITERHARCPSCDAPVTFRSPGPHVETCTSCRLALLRIDRRGGDVRYKLGWIEVVVPANRSGFEEDEDEVPVAALTCGSCGGSLRWEELSPRGFFTCRHCDAVTECRHVTPARAVFTPNAPTDPYLPVGAEGRIRDRDVRVTGLVTFASDTGEGEEYLFEYMLETGPRATCTRLLEMGGAWYLVTPLRPEDVQLERIGTKFVKEYVSYNGALYELAYAYTAILEHSVQVPDPCVEERRSSNAEYFNFRDNLVRIENRQLYKIYHAFCERLSPEEVADGFGLESLPPGRRTRKKARLPGFVKRADAFLEAIGPIVMSGMLVLGLLMALSMIRC